MANTGRVYTLIVKGDPKEAEKVLLDVYKRQGDMCTNADEHRDNKGQDLRNNHKCRRRYDIRHKQLPSVHRK